MPSYKVTYNFIFVNYKNAFFLKNLYDRRLVNLHIEISKLHGLRRANSIHTSLKHTFSPRTLDVLRQTMRPRYPHRLVLVVGGWSRDSPTNVTEAYDPLTETWFDISPTMPPILQVRQANSCYKNIYFIFVGAFRSLGLTMVSLT